MKLLSTPKSQRDAIAPLITVSRLMGIRIFEYPRGRPRSILSLFYLSVHFSLAFTSLHAQHKYYLSVKLLKLEYFLYEFLLYLSMVIILCEMFLGWYHTKHLNVCYRKISKIDETLRQLGLTINYNVTHYVTIGAIIAWFIFIVVTSILSMLVIRLRTNLQITIWVTVSQAYEFSISFVVIFEFSIFVRCLQMRFKLVNQLLSEGVATSSKERTKLGLSSVEDFRDKMMNVDQKENSSPMIMLPQLNRQVQSQISRISVLERRNSVVSQIRHHLPFQLQKQFQIELQNQSRNQIDSVIAMCRRRKHLFQTLRQVHLELCKVSKILCTSFGMQIASEIGLSIMFTTEILYNLYARLFQRHSDFFSLIEQAILVITLGITYVLKVVYVNHVCKNATDEGNKITEIIHAIYGCCVDVDMRNEINQFGLQISCSPMKFHAFGFSLNYNLLSSCFGMITTYLVIMVQMSNSLGLNKYVHEEKIQYR